VKIHHSHTIQSGALPGRFSPSSLRRKTHRMLSLYLWWCSEHTHARNYPQLNTSIVQRRNLNLYRVNFFGVPRVIKLGRKREGRRRAILCAQRPHICFSLERNWTGAPAHRENSWKSEIEKHTHIRSLTHMFGPNECVGGNVLLF
jgi:hypothetical protein